MTASRATAAPTAPPGTGWRRWSLAVLFGFVGANAVYGGIGLVVNGLGMPEDWLDHTPFASWTLPGLALLATVALPQLVGLWLVVRRHPRAALGSALVGAALIAWIVVQLAVLRRYFFLQPVIAGLGVVELLIAWSWLRHDRR